MAEPREGDFAGNFLELLGGRKQYAQPRAADVFEVAAVHEDFRAFFVKELVEGFFEVGGCRDIEPPVEGYNRHVVAFFFCDFHNWLRSL